MENNKTVQETMVYDWLENWLEVYAKPTVKQPTYLTYWYSIVHIKSFLSDKPLKDVKEIDCQRILNNMAIRKYAKSTIIKVKILLKRAFYVAVRNDYITKNVAEQLTIPQASVKRVVCLTQEEQVIVENACKVTLYGDFALFMLNTGLRSREMRELKWSDYSEDDMEFKVVNSKTAAGVRTIPLIRISNEIIKKQPRINEYIFNNSRGFPVSVQVLKRLYERLQKITGIKKINNHIYRHSFATRALERGMNYKVLSEILGHTDIAFTLKIYTHIQIQFLHEQMKLMERDYN